MGRRLPCQGQRLLHIVLMLHVCPFRGTLSPLINAGHICPNYPYTIHDGRNHHGQTTHHRSLRSAIWKQELLRTTDALKDAYTRFNCVCDSELIEASIYEISALKARCNYLLRRIKELSGEAVPSAIPRARPVQAAAAAASAPEEAPAWLPAP